MNTKLIAAAPEEGERGITIKTDDVDLVRYYIHY
jgi:translation elongation factor EF-Tu-like GTPase